jgi:hypothetical protein
MLFSGAFTMDAGDELNDSHILRVSLAHARA